MNAQAPLVSILLPAYRFTFFEQALISALRQTYKNIEVIVCDDSQERHIEELVYRQNDTRMRYIKNKNNLGLAGNFTKCFNLAQGEFINFLNDDDLLHANHVERMLYQFLEYGRKVTLVTSKRCRINEFGLRLKDSFSTQPLAKIDCYIKGRDLAEYALKHSTNFIGEPTTAMFRKQDLDAATDNIFRIGTNEYTCLADMSLWLRLLNKGDAVYLADELSAYRIHPGQEQHKFRVAARCTSERYYLTLDGDSLGFLQERGTKKHALTSVLRRFDAALASKNLARELRDEIEGLRKLLIGRLQQ